MITVVLADDHRMVRQGFKLLLEADPEIRVIGEAASGLEAVELVTKLHPDILVTDLKMPGTDGFKVTEETGKRSPETKVIVLSMYGEMAYVSRALRSGAACYVLKSSGADDLLDAVHAALEGCRFLSQPISEEAIRAYERRFFGET